MSRLIDADLLIELLASHDDITLDEFTEKALIQMINEQPTAYDIEKVVWELECEKTIWCGKKITTTDNIKIDDAIEIVKKGGVEWNK